MMSKYPDKFTLPDDRIPKAWAQGLYKCCGMASVVKCIEVANAVNTGEYTMLSKGYAYGRHSNPVYKSFKSDVGIDYDYTMKSILERGTVPEEMYPAMNELPDIIDDVANHPNIAELDKVAEKTKAKVTKIDGNAFFRENVKKWLYEKKLPLVGNMTGQHHCTVIVGWDGKKFQFCDHDGRIDSKTGRSYIYGGGKFNFAYGIEIEKKEDDIVADKLFNTGSFKEYIEGLKVTRDITRVQLHHTYSPSYKDFKGNNHASLQSSMRNYHINDNGWNDIGQHFTIFPDGKIMTGRDINTTPAGIYGANTGAICIECLGNFDIGGDIMTEVQKSAIVSVVKTLLDKFGLNAEDNVTYHAWWSSDGRGLGDYYKTHSAKTCPGTNFFGGNGLTAYHNNLMPLLKGENKDDSIKLEAVTEINDIVWELANAGIITNSGLWMLKCEDDINIYWLCRKMANKLRGTL